MWAPRTSSTWARTSSTLPLFYDGHLDVGADLFDVYHVAGLLEAQDKLAEAIRSTSRRSRRLGFVHPSALILENDWANNLPVLQKAQGELGKAKARSLPPARTNTATTF